MGLLDSQVIFPGSLEIESLKLVQNLSITKGKFIIILKSLYLLEILELLVSGQSFLLIHSPVDSNGREILLNQQLSQSNASLHALDENDDLVEFQDIQKLEQFSILFCILQLAVMLLQTVQSQLGLVVNVNLHGLKI